MRYKPFGLFIFITILLSSGCSLITATKPGKVSPGFTSNIDTTLSPTDEAAVLECLGRGRPDLALQAPQEVFRTPGGVRLQSAALAMQGRYEEAHAALSEAWSIFHAFPESWDQEKRIPALGKICEDMIWLSISRGDYHSAQEWLANLTKFCAQEENALAELWTRLAEKDDSQLVIPDKGCVLPLIGTPFPRIKVLVNGRQSNFLLDTGAGMTVVSASRAKAWGLPILNLKDSVRGMGSISIHYTIIDNLQMGDVSLTNIPALVIEDKDLTFNALGVFKLIDIPGIIGMPVLARMRFSMDFPNHQITFSPSSKTVPEGGTELVYWRNQMFVPITFAELGRRVFFVDTGANRSSLSYRLAQNLPDSIKIDRGSRSHAIGAGGSMVMGGIYSPAWLALGTMKLEELGLDLESASREQGDEIIKRDGILGVDILQCFRFTVDVPARRFWLELPAVEKVRRR